MSKKDFVVKRSMSKGRYLPKRCDANFKDMDQMNFKGMV